MRTITQNNGGALLRALLEQGARSGAFYAYGDRLTLVVGETRRKELDATAAGAGFTVALEGSVKGIPPGGTRWVDRDALRRALGCQRADVAIRWNGAGQLALNGELVPTMELKEPVFVLNELVGGKVARGTVGATKLSDIASIAPRHHLRYILNGVLLDFESGALVASDGYRMHLWTDGVAAKPGDGVHRVIVPARAAQAIADLQLARVETDGRVVIATAGAIKLRTLALIGSYPPYEVYLRDLRRIGKAKFRDSAMSTLRRALKVRNAARADSGLLVVPGDPAQPAIQQLRHGRCEVLESLWSSADHAQPWIVASPRRLFDAVAAAGAGAEAAVLATKGDGIRQIGDRRYAEGPILIASPGRPGFRAFVQPEPPADGVG